MRKSRVLPLRERTACHVQRRAQRGKKKASCSAHRRAGAASRVPKRGFVLVQSVLRGRTGRSSTSRLLCLQVSRHILTRHQRPKVTPLPRSGVRLVFNYLQKK